MIWNDADGRDELARMGLVAGESRPGRDELAVLALVGAGEPGQLGGDPFSVKDRRRRRSGRCGTRTEWFPSRRLARLALPTK
jgi:hypothetical protein